LDCYFIGADLVIANKVGYRELPYDRYTLKTQRNNLYWSYFHISSVMRPVCFVSTIETQRHFINWCNDYTPGIRYTDTNMMFWCFTYNYCDRSNWNTISDYSKAFFEINAQDRLLIQQLVDEEVETYSESSHADSCSSEVEQE
jgi:hypothetical protein